METTQKNIPELNKLLLKIVDRTAVETGQLGNLTDPEAVEHQANAVRLLTESVASLATTITHLEAEIARDARGDRW